MEVLQDQAIDAGTTFCVFGSHELLLITKNDMRVQTCFTRAVYRQFGIINRIVILMTRIYFVATTYFILFYY